MKILVDMNLSPAWVVTLTTAGFEAVHWSDVGDPRAMDEEVMRWAKESGATVFTHDLDFGAILASTGGDGPSVVQVRTQDVSPEHLAALVIVALRQFEEILVRGAIISIDEFRMRSRILPLKPAV